MKNHLPSIPRRIYNAIELYDPADRGMAYSAILAFLDTGEVPDMSAMSGAARGAFELARPELERILNRRKRAAERRLNGPSPMKAARPGRKGFVMSELDLGLPSTYPGGITGEPTPRVRIGDELLRTTPPPNMPLGDIADPRMLVRAIYDRMGQRGPEFRNKFLKDEFSIRFPGRELLDHNESGYFALATLSKDKQE